MQRRLDSLLAGMLLSLHIRFGASAYDNLMESLTRLRQVGSVSTYKAQFEALSNRIKELFEKHKLSCFLNGLRDEIRLPIRMLNPQNLSSAFGLAKIQEEYLFTSKKSTRPWIEVPKPSILGPPRTIKTDVKTSKFPVQRLLAAQIEEKRIKGLGFHCEEKWQVGHQYKTPRIFLMEGLVGSSPECQLQEVSEVNDV